MKVAIGNTTQDHMGEEIVFVMELEGFYHDVMGFRSNDKTFPAGTRGTLEFYDTSGVSTPLATIYIENNIGKAEPWEFYVDESIEFEFVNIVEG